MTWYIAQLHDKGAGRNKQSFYVEGETKEEATTIAKENAANDMDPESVSLTKTNKDEQDLKKSLFMSGLNRAVRENGEVLQRSDVDSDDF